MVSSSIRAGAVWEIWLFAEPNHRIACQMCGLFLQCRDAEGVAVLVNDWLHFGVFGPALHEAVPCQEDRDELWALPEFLHNLGVNPVRVRVKACRRGHETDDNSVGVDPDDVPSSDDDDDQDDTDTLPVDLPPGVRISDCDESA